MPRIIDSFLFFQELDLLDIRLGYLDPYVDVFVIVEACQTFSGTPKPFVFEQNRERYSKYAHKIYYHKICDAHRSFESLQKFLRENPTASKTKVLKILVAHDHYPKTGLHWVLDTYHRERIHFALDAIATDDDIVILSDLDEIPKASIFTDGTLSTFGEQPRVCRQHEFRYSVNLYKDSNWLGSIFSNFKQIRDQSLNTLRIDSKAARKIVHTEAIDSGGYHFTSCGSVETIARKIESWAHQEFNTSAVLKGLEHNIRTGQDIFGREHGTNLTKIDVGDERFFDARLTRILREYPELICEYEITVVESTRLYGALMKIRKATQKALYKASGALRERT